MQRPSAVPARRNTMRPPPSMRPSTGRTLSAIPPPNGRVSPAESVVSSTSSKPKSPSTQGTKRKAGELEVEGTEETNINVVVRCRGRNEREVRENSGVVVSTNGVKGNAVELSMGPNAVSNKSYQFDKVFSSAADQLMLFNEVVAPICDEVMSGFNCTLFAYGQTGTGKTYTMSGDITDTLPLPDAAGIIPRVLHHLFGKLEKEEALESNVKCSFIELYNEELRDLLAVDESVKLKIYDDATKKGHAATLVQGMEEFHIKSASSGIGLLRSGSHKRQVAATKCNDLSSRSHTVFTITVYLKRTSDTGEDLVSAGKLNLVDLAGSENIQRSGAENKRAAEAGLINRSLLTLGRVINALVDKGSHIPYRESKLTRLLQDSLGGRTKTCIIATLSPAKSNLEETISTLDYAFRAKNIRNKPQMNQLMSKKTLIREFTAEIEKLKGELIATRQRNGVYLTSESFDEITTESESRRILTEEQRDKLETMEANLRNKAQELYSLTNSFNGLKRDSEAVQATLNGTQDVLQKIETVLRHTEQNLRDETLIRQAHQTTEADLARIGGNLIASLGQTTQDIAGLHDKIRRRSDLQDQNRKRWGGSQAQVSDVTSLVQQKLRGFEAQHKSLMGELSSRMTGFLEQELDGLTRSQALLADKEKAFESAEAEVNTQTGKARDDMNNILGEIKALKEDVKSKVGEGLEGLSTTAQRISAGVMTELESYQNQLHTSYRSLGKDFKHTFDELVDQLNRQREESDQLRKELHHAHDELRTANDIASTKLSVVLSEEKAKAAADRESLISQMSAMIRADGEAQDRRLESRITEVQDDIRASSQRYEEKHLSYHASTDGLSMQNKQIVDDILKSRESVKAKIKKDWTTANEYHAKIQTTTHAVHDETVRIVDEQMQHLDVQLQALDHILSKVREQNTKHHDAHIVSLSGLASSVKQSYKNIGDHFVDSSRRAQLLDADFSQHSLAISNTVPVLEESVHQPLTELRDQVTSAPLLEYAPTGETPQKRQYAYQTALPRTQPHEQLLNGQVETRSDASSPDMLGALKLSPSKTSVFVDAAVLVPVSTSEPHAANRSPVRPETSHSSLRELDANVVPTSRADMTSDVSTVDSKSIQMFGKQPPLKRQNAGSVMLGADNSIKDFSASIGSKLPKRANAAEGRENVPFATSIGPGGRQLRSRNS